VDAAVLRRDIGRFLEAIARREDVRASAQSLYVAIAKPIDAEARRAGAKRLVLWLDGALRYVPFAVLHDGERYLVDRYAIESYMPRLDGVASQGPGLARAPDRLNVRGLGVTRAVGGFEPLPAMADELCDVVRGPIEGLEAPGRMCPRPQLGAGALEGAGFADAAFTSERFRSLLAEDRQFSVLHLGTHFSLRPGNARRSFLVLGDGSRLTLDSIAGLDFHGLKLVTLSACQSGLGGATTDDGREVEGLSAIVQRRGAQHVVASLWRVEDRSTARLMREMYASLASAGGDAATALRRSQLKLRALRQGGSRTYEHPYYWGGFLISGSR
jgi:CHAT domain-containing protein